jgi:hypothetical protein
MMAAPSEAFDENKLLDEPHRAPTKALHPLGDLSPFASLKRKSSIQSPLPAPALVGSATVDVNQRDLAVPVQCLGRQGYEAVEGLSWSLFLRIQSQRQDPAVTERVEAWRTSVMEASVPFHGGAVELESTVLAKPPSTRPATPNLINDDDEVVSRAESKTGWTAEEPSNPLWWQLALLCNSRNRVVDVSAQLEEVRVHVS